MVKGNDESRPPVNAAALTRAMEELIPFNRFLGVKVEAIADGYCRLVVPFRDELVGDPMRPALHGGVLSALADTAGGCAVWAGLSDASARVATIDMRIDYLRPGRLVNLVAEARVVRRGNRVGVTDMFLFHPDEPGNFVATGKGVYNIVLPKDGSPGLGGA